MQDKLWVVYERPRWLPGFMRNDDHFDDFDDKDLGNYLCSIGSLDAFRTDELQVRVVRDPTLAFGHNYTMVVRTHDPELDVPLRLTDEDVEPTPFEMCALYQMAHLLRDRDWRPDLTENRV